MSTRSYITMKTGDDTYRGVYCHYDGYLEYNGRLLLEHYNTQERVEKLLSLGCISSLKEKLEPEAGSRHCFDTPDKDVTVFYGKDRGEKDRKLLPAPKNNSKIRATGSISSMCSTTTHGIIARSKGTGFPTSARLPPQSKKSMNKENSNEHKRKERKGDRASERDGHLCPVYQGLPRERHGMLL